jgi:5-enolpyruvylshikimate-3-phosphate synthase
LRWRRSDTGERSLPTPIAVPAPSSAAFPLVAALIVEGSEIARRDAQSAASA